MSEVIQKETVKPTDPFVLFLETFEHHTAAVQTMEKIDLAVNAKVAQMVSAESANGTAYRAASAQKLTTQEALIEAVKAHPEWFAGKKTINTPHGAIAKRASSSLAVADERVTLSKIVEGHADNEGLAAIFQKETLGEIMEHLSDRLLGPARHYLNLEITLNLEALEKLTDRDLLRLGVRRVESETITVKPLVVKIGTAAAETAEKQPEAPVVSEK